MNETETAARPQPELAATLAELLAHLKRQQAPVKDELWTCDDVAAWLKLASDTVERRVITRPDFPPPLQPCQTGKRAARRWFAEDVRKWARIHSSQLPQPRHPRPRQSSRAATSEAVAL